MEIICEELGEEYSHFIKFICLSRSVYVSVLSNSVLDMVDGWKGRNVWKNIQGKDFLFKCKCIKFKEARGS